jgi:hypothetical protein
VARRYQLLSEEIAELDEQLDRLVADAAPKLTALPGIGTDHAATLLTVALKTTHSASRVRPLSPASAESRPSKRPQERWSGTDSTEVVTGMPIAACT